MPIDMIRVKMRDQNRIDRFGIDRLREVIEHAAGRVGDPTSGSVSIKISFFVLGAFEQRGEDIGKMFGAEDAGSERLIDVRAAGVPHQSSSKGRDQTPSKTAVSGNY